MEKLKGNQSGFFAVHKSSFHKACDLGMNATVAYLLLANGTDKSNTYTSWSVHAIETYTGISRKRAKEAIEKLIAAELIRKINEVSANPRYELLFTEPVSPKTKSKKAATLQPAPLEERLNPDKTIWLPNGIVQSVTGECPPLERIRQTQDVMILRLFVDLYSEQNLVDDVGINRFVYWGTYEKKELIRYAEFTVYGFESKNQWMSWVDTTNPHKGEGEERATSFFKRIGVLIQLGLITGMPYLFDSDSKEGEPIHQLDDKINDFVSSAAYEMLLKIMQDEGRAQSSIDNYHYVVPVPSHFINIALIDVYEMRYKPRTKLTAMGYKEKEQRARKAKEQYAALLERVRPMTNKVQHQGYINF